MDEVVWIRYFLNYKNILYKVVNDPGPCMNGLIKPRVLLGWLKTSLNFNSPRIILGLLHLGLWEYFDILNVSMRYLTPNWTKVGWAEGLHKHSSFAIP
jgi:hypothetical protein